MAKRQKKKKKLQLILVFSGITLTVSLITKKLKLFSFWSTEKKKKKRTLEPLFLKIGAVPLFLGRLSPGIEVEFLVSRCQLSGERILFLEYHGEVTVFSEPCI